MIFGLEKLLQMRLFAGMTRKEVESIILRCRYHAYQKGECIVREGEACTAFGLIADGSIVIQKENAAGENQILAKMSAGQIFGEILVYSTRKKWPATIWATEPSGIYFMDLVKLSDGQIPFSELHGKLMRNFMRELSDKALALNKKLEYLSLKKMRGKIAKYLLEQGSHQAEEYFQISFNRKELADFLAVSRTALSRELARMREEGLLDYHKSRFKILDWVGMEKAIE